MSVEEDKIKQELDQKRLEDEKAKAEGDGVKKNEIRRRRHHHHHHHHHGSRKRRRRRRRIRKLKRFAKRFVITAGLLLLAAVIIVVGAVFTMRHSGKRALYSDNINITAPKDLDVRLTDNGATVTYKGERYRYNKDIITMLFMGVDKADSAQDSSQIGENHQADMILLCTIDKVNKKITLTNVPRDTITEVNVYSPAGGYVGIEKLPIAVSYAYGDGKTTSCYNTTESVRRIFYNVPIPTYYSLNLDGIAAINDSVGGVDVTSPETIGPFEEGKTYHLVGDMATDFVQLRAKDRPDANLLRNERQRVYMNAILKKFITATRQDISVPIDLYNAAKPYSCTNLNADRVTYLATEFIVNRDMAINFQKVPVTVTQVDNHAENYVKEEEFYELFLKIFYNKVS